MARIHLGKKKKIISVFSERDSRQSLSRWKDIRGSLFTKAKYDERTLNIEERVMTERKKEKVKERRRESSHHGYGRVPWYGPVRAKDRDAEAGVPTGRYSITRYIVCIAIAPVLLGYLALLSLCQRSTPRRWSLSSARHPSKGWKSRLLSLFPSIRPLPVTNHYPTNDRTTGERLFRNRSFPRMGWHASQEGLAKLWIPRLAWLPVSRKDELSAAFSFMHDGSSTRFKKRLHAILHVYF